MANDITIKDGAGTDAVVATRDKAGREVQLVQLDLGDSSTVTPAEGALPVSNAALGAPADSVATSDTGTWSISALLKRLLGKSKPVELPDGGVVMPVTGTMKKWVDDFGGTTLDTTLWDIFDGGVYPGGTAGVGANGSGVSMGSPTINNSTFVLAMGTTANAEMHLLSKQTFTVPVDVVVAVQQSQAIANNTLNIELVEIDPGTGYPLAHATLAGECRNRGGVVLQGTTTTTYTLEAASDDSPNGANTVAVTGGVNWTTAAVDVQQEFRTVDLWLSSIGTDGFGARAGSGRLSRQVPDPNKLYKLRIRWRNGAVAPASSTTTTLFRVAVIDVQEISVELGSGRGDSSLGRALSVTLPGAGGSASQIQGAYPDNSTDGPGQPVGVAGLMTSAVGGPAVGTTARGGVLQMDLARRIVTRLFGTPQSHVSARLAAQTGTTEVTLLAAQGATLRSELQSLTIANHDTVAVKLDLRDAAAGTIRESYTIPAGETQQFTWPGGRPAAALNAAWTLQARAATTTNGWDACGSFFVTTA